MKKLKDILSSEQIAFIIEMRKAGTYRYVAQEFALKYPQVEINPGNQIDGIELVNAVISLGYKIDE